MWYKVLMFNYFRNVFRQRRYWLDYIKDNSSDLVARVRISNEGELALFKDSILKRQGALGEVQSLKGVTASVENIGARSARGTFTRSAIHSGWQKGLDDREMFLYVDGPEFSWVIPFPGSAGYARSVAAQINLTARTNYAA